ncbi:MAG: Serine/threonine-protein kinase PknL [Planctomycetes bacterium ADurb.Bin126]|nr:MAG: Serine/threonine-protein kinase PknL [Planctomycetes bacterium ADurb.Bin126]HOD84379.1 serine/threonine-protein kinase [Phycisphaerae bacterium]HQL76296.1 serine/threonine-protein kinase [Phycisphaerae bacterium]
MGKAQELYGMPWGRREYILVLDAYLQSDCSWFSPEDAPVRVLAKLLGRTPAAVVMRMENFASLDPARSETRKGLGHISPLGMRIFEEYFQKRESLRDLAEFLQGEARARDMPLFDDPVIIPRAFGKYELGDLIGDGGFGTVYSCLHTDTSRAYAIKIIKTDKIHDHEVRQRFIREMRALKAIKHPHVICLHEENLDSEEELPAFIMDLAVTSLHEYMMQRSREMGDSVARPLLRRVDAVTVFTQVLSAVAALHKATPRIIHRDINPRNVLLMPDGVWVLADFSLAKFLHSAPVTTAFATQSGQAWATEGYAAPEQYRDFKHVDERGDVFSLGVLLWELFSSAWPPRRTEALMLPPALEPICAKATSWELKDRYACVAELEEAFNGAIQNLN